MNAFTRIVSGGQTGVDRAALDFAIRHGWKHGGWCPHGRRAEDGMIPNTYRLRETESAEYEVRTEKNVLDSDATLIVVREAPLSGGTAFTRDLAERNRRPVLIVRERDGVEHAAAALVKWLQHYSVRTLNVAGPRESQAPGIGRFVENLLAAAVSAGFRRHSSASKKSQAAHGA